MFHNLSRGNVGNRKCRDVFCERSVGFEHGEAHKAELVSNLGCRVGVQMQVQKKRYFLLSRPVREVSRERKCRKDRRVPEENAGKYWEEIG